VVLVSGGLDSALVLRLVRAKGYDVHALCFDYGQSNRKEIGYAQEQTRRETGRELTVVSLDYKALTPSLAMLGGDETKLGSLTIIPWRTAVFVNLAVAHAMAVDARYVFVGNQIDGIGDKPVPDARLETYQFLFELLEDLDRLATRNAHVRVVAPLIHLNKQSILTLCARRGITLDTTWSCLRSEKAPCGACKTCKQIAGASQ